MQVKYHIYSDDKRELNEHFIVKFDEPVTNTEDNPAWTELTFEQCENCPLTTEKHCPLAVTLHPIINKLGHLRSFIHVTAEIELEDKTLTIKADAQDLIGSLMGLIFSSSDCPHTQPFRPMGRYHLPLASIDETFYRVASMYALGQLFRYHEGLSVDIQFKGLEDIYQNISKVNSGIVKRIKTAAKDDATLNAVAILDALAQFIPSTLEDGLEDLKPLFSAYLEAN